MQNQFLPEDTPEYRLPAPIVSQTEAVAETQGTAGSAAKTAALQAELEAAKRSAGRRASYFLLGGYAAFLGPLFCLMLTTSEKHPLSWTNAIAASVALFLTGSGTMYFAANRGRPYRDYSRLVQTYGADAIPLLLQGRQNSLSRANTKAVDAAILEALALADANSTCLSERGCSYFRLILRGYIARKGKRAYNPVLTLAILDALNRVGDPSYLSLVEKLACLNARNPDSKRIRDAARECLPLLREREQIIGKERRPLPQSEAAATDAALENTTVSRQRQAQLRQLSRRHKVRPVIGMAVGCGAFASINIYINIVKSLETPSAIYQSIWIFLAVFCGASFGAAWWLLRGSRLKAKNLNQYGGLKTVGALIEMLGAAYLQPDKEALQTALTPLLLQLRPEDSNRLNRRQRAILNRSLQSLTNGTRLYEVTETFDLAVLQALEQVGDRSAVPVVEKLTRMDADTTAKIHIRRAAIDCLPLLQIRAGLVAEGKTLLRASAPEAAGHDTLLRAASGSSDKAPEQLLRPSDSGE